MTVSKTVTLTLDNSDAAISLLFYLPHGATVPTGIMVQLNQGTPPVPPVTLAQALAGTGFTAAQAGTFLRAVRDAILTANGYA